MTRPGTFPPAGAGELFEALGQRRLPAAGQDAAAVQWLVDAELVRRFRDGSEQWLELND